MAGIPENIVAQVLLPNCSLAANVVGISCAAEAADCSSRQVRPMQQVTTLFQAYCA